MPKLKDPEIQREVTSRVINAIERLIELGLVKNHFASFQATRKPTSPKS